MNEKEIVKEIRSLSSEDLLTFSAFLGLLKEGKINSEMSVDEMIDAARCVALS